MQALGLIETRGFLPAIECADIMLKTAQVELVERSLTGGGLVTIIVTGDVGAVKAAVEAGAAAVAKISPCLLISQHVIPRPNDSIGSIVGQANSATDPAIEARVSIEPSIGSDQTMFENLHKKEFDAFIQKFGAEEGMNTLKSLSVVKLRNLAREYKELGIAGRAISKANKELLLQQLTGYYARKE